jgi:predicted DNA-binding transcriptional regulator AlpA
VKSKTKPAAQVAPAKKAAALKAAGKPPVTRPVTVTPRVPQREPVVAPPPAQLGPTNQSQGPPPLRFLSRDEVLKLVGVSYPTLWAWIRAGTFPPARELSGNTRASRIYWLEHEVLTWMANRPPRLPRGTVAIYKNNAATEA